MKQKTIIDWLNKELEVSKFDDVSNNGLQIENRKNEISHIAVAVDASLESVKAAATAGAELLIVHHGISWGGGIRRLTGGIYNVVKAAMDADLAIYACHLPLDASKKYGNNWELARYFGLKNIKKAFNYHGNVIGVTGKNKHGRKIGICSGGAGEFAETAKTLGCDLYVTGEASWGEIVSARNCGMEMICAGHYETEVFGVRAIGKALKETLGLKVTDLTK